MKKLILISTIALSTGCAVTQQRDATTGRLETNSRTKNTMTGVGLGAALGAGLGAIFDGGNGARLGASIGAGVGGLAGYGSGHYLDNAEKELRENLSRTGVKVVKQGDSIKLVMPSTVMFKTDSHTIDRRFYSVLESIGLVLKEYPETKIVVTGHTDSTGSFKTNQILSENRALSVSRFFHTVGVEKNRINYSGFADRFPVSGNRTKSQRTNNRRVEILIEKI